MQVGGIQGGRSPGAVARCSRHTSPVMKTFAEERPQRSGGLIACLFVSGRVAVSPDLAAEAASMPSAAAGYA